MPVPVRTGSELTPRRCRRAELRRELTEVYKSVDNLRKELKEVRRENSTLRRARVNERGREDKGPTERYLAGCPPS